MQRDMRKLSFETTGTSRYLEIREPSLPSPRVCMKSVSALSPTASPLDRNDHSVLLLPTEHRIATIVLSLSSSHWPRLTCKFLKSYRSPLKKQKLLHNVPERSPDRTLGKALFLAQVSNSARCPGVAPRWVSDHIGHDKGHVAAATLHGQCALSQQCQRRVPVKARPQRPSPSHQSGR